MTKFELFLPRFWIFTWHFRLGLEMVEVRKICHENASNHIGVNLPCHGGEGGGWRGFINHYPTLSIDLSIYLSIYLSVCLPVCLIETFKPQPSCCDILTLKSASCHNGAQFFNIRTAKTGPKLAFFVHFDLAMCFAPHGLQFFDI